MKRVFYSLSLLGTIALFAQSVTDVNPVYPPGQTAAKTGDWVWITAQLDPFMPDSVWCNATSIGGAVDVQMYDDGNHNDKVANDGIFGTDSIWVDTVGTAYHRVTVWAIFNAGADTVSCPGEVGVDNQHPFVTGLGTVYPVGQSAAKDSDYVTVKSYISDVKGYVDVVLAMDNSGSMADTATGDTISKMEAAKLAADTFLMKMDSLDRAAMWAFWDDGNWATTSQETLKCPPPPPLNGFTYDKQWVMDSVNALYPYTWTPLYDIICETSLHAQTSPNIPAVIAMTDGQDAGPGGGNGSDEYTRQDCYFQPIPIFTIGFGDTANVDTAFLDSVARTSAGGKFYMAPNAATLDSIYREISNIIASWDAPKGISEAWVDASPFGGPNKVLLYDDGGHNDGAAGDTIFGSDPILVDTTITDTVLLPIYATDVALNQWSDTTFSLLDNILPLADSLKTTYPSGKNVVHNGEKVYFSVQVSDTGVINGIMDVELDATQIGGLSNIPMRDDGTGNDAVAGDGIYTSDSLVVNTGVYSGTAAVYAFAYDIAGNTRVAAGGVVVDNIAPEIKNVQVVYPSGQTAVKVGDAVKISALITDDISGVMTDTLDATNLDGNKYVMVDDGTNGDEVSGDKVYTYTVNITNGATGTVAFTITAADSESNASGPVQGTVLLDNAAPGAITITVSDPDSIYRNGETVKLLASTDASGYTVTADFSTIDNNYVTGAENVQDNGDGTYTITYTISETNTRADGGYTITVTAKDGAGNTTNGTKVLVLSNLGPNVLSVSLDDADDVLGANDTLRATITDTNGVIAAEYFVDVIKYDGAGIPMTLDNPGADSVNAKDFMSITGLSEGQHTVYVHGEDSTKIWGGYQSLNFIVDTQGPVISNVQVQYPSGQNSVKDGDNVIITAHIADATTSVDSIWLDGMNINTISDNQMYDDGTNGDEVPGDGIYTATLTVNTGFTGNEPFTIYSRDVVPNQSSVSGTVVLDNAVPGAITITISDPDSIYRNGETVKLLASTDASGYTVTADFSTIDNNYVSSSENVQDNGDGTYTITYTISETNTRANGGYTITVTAADDAGNTTNGTKVLVLDNSGPKASNLDFAVDPKDDNILNENDTLTAVITDTNGVIAAEYFVDVIKYDGTGIPMTLDNPGADTVNVSKFFSIDSLTEGEHKVYIHGEDSTGIWGPYKSLSFIVDTKGPEIENVAVVYPEAQDAVKDSQYVLIKARIVDLTTDVDTDNVWIDGTNLNGNPNIKLNDAGVNGDEVAGDHIYSRNVLIATGDNLTAYHTFAIYANDIVPNQSTISDSVFVDNTLPVFTSNSTPVNEDKIYRNGEKITIITEWDGSDYKITADFSGIDANYVEGAEEVVNNGDSTYTITYHISEDNTMADAKGIIIPITVYDAVGNGPVIDSSYTVELDNTPPYFYSVDANKNTYINGDTIKIISIMDDTTYTLSADFSVIDSKYTAGAEVVSRADTVYTITYVISGENTTPDGSYSIKVRAVDIAGNVSEQATSVELDNTPEPVTFIKPESGQILKGDVIIEVTVPDDASKVCFQVSPDNGAHWYNLNGTTSPDTATIDSLGSDGWKVVWHTDTDSLPDATTYLIKAYAYDELGDFIAYSILDGNIVIDNTPPSLSFSVSPVPIGLDSLHGEVGTPNIKIDGVCSDIPDSLGVEKIIFEIKDTAGVYIWNSPIIIQNENNTFSVSPVLVRGMNYITITAIDKVGNRFSENAEIVGDTTKPVINQVFVYPVPKKGDSLNGEVYTSKVLLTGNYYDSPDSLGIEKLTIEITDEDGNALYDKPVVLENKDNTFRKFVELVQGENHIHIEVVDRLGNIGSKDLILTYIVPEVSMVIGADGGTIESPDGTKLVIPKGALLKDTKLTIKKIPASDLVPPSDTAIHLMSVAHLFEPEGLVFHKPVDVVLTYTDYALDKDQDGIPDEPESLLAPFFYTGSKWVKADAGDVKPDSNTITLTVNHLSIYDIGVDNRVLPGTFALYLTKNPFKLNEGTTIVFSAPSAGALTVKIYDLTGDLVSTVVKGFNISGKGEYSIRWNGLSQFDRFLGSGIYIYVAYFKPASGDAIVIRKPIGIVK